MQIPTFYPLSGAGASQSQTAEGMPIAGSNSLMQKIRRRWGNRDCTHPRGPANAVKDWTRRMVLLLPMALAAAISPDHFGITSIQNRGIAESAEKVPLLWTKTSKRFSQDQDLPSQPSSPEQDELTMDPPKKWVPPNAPQFSQSKDVMEADYPSNPTLEESLRGRKNGKPALLAMNERPDENTPLGNLQEALKQADSSWNHSTPLRTGRKGNAIKTNVIDLLVAAQTPALINKISGKRVEITGQILNGEKGNSRILRLLILCCTADAQPLAVRVENHGHKKPTQMTWVKVTGKAIFARRQKQTTLVIQAESITTIPHRMNPTFIDSTYPIPFAPATMNRSLATPPKNLLSHLLLHPTKTNQTVHRP